MVFEMSKIVKLLDVAHCCTRDNLFWCSFQGRPCGVPFNDFHLVQIYRPTIAQRMLGMVGLRVKEAGDANNCLTIG
jgi:hypothetical protein